jgi:hypothetical protein
MLTKFLWKTAADGIVVVSLLLWFTEATFWGAVLTSVALSAIAYLLGDRIVLPASNNIIATVADGLLAFLFLWLVAYFSNWTLTFTELTAIVILLGFVEYVFHLYLLASDTGRATQ